MKAVDLKVCRKKAFTKQTPDGLPVQSSQDVLANLSTIIRGWVRPKSIPIEPFTMTTTSTPHQHRILDLLGVAVDNR